MSDYYMLPFAKLTSGECQHSSGSKGQIHLLDNSVNYFLTRRPLTLLSELLGFGLIFLCGGKET